MSNVVDSWTKENNIKKWLGIGSVNCKSMKKSFLKKKFLHFCKHFINGKQCRKNACSYLHKIPANIEDEMNLLTVNDTKFVFAQIAVMKRLFATLFPFVVERLKILKCTKALLELIDEILVLEVFDKTPYISLILEALITEAGSLKQAINVITNNFGIGKNVICDILLSLVVSREESLTQNWGIISNFINSNNNVDYGVISDIMEKCNAEPLNKELFMLVSSSLIPHTASAKLVPAEIFSKFIHNLTQLNLQKFANIFTKTSETLKLSVGEIEKESTDTSSGISSQLQENESLNEESLLHNIFKKNDSVTLNQESLTNNIVVMNDLDFVNLANTVFEEKIVGYVDLLLKYNKNDGLKECFVVNSIAVFKNFRANIYDIFIKIYDYIGKYLISTMNFCLY